MREPHIRAQPAQILDVVNRAAAEFLQAERFLVQRFAEVGVQADAVFSGERGSTQHELAGHRER